MKTKKKDKYKRQNIKKKAKTPWQEAQWNGPCRKTLAGPLRLTLSIRIPKLILLLLPPSLVEEKRRSRRHHRYQTW